MNENENNFSNLYPQDMEFNPKTMSFTPIKKESQKSEPQEKSTPSQYANGNNPLLSMLGTNKNLSSLLSGNNNPLASIFSGKANKNDLLMQALTQNLTQKNAPKETSSPPPSFEEF
ncbi:MAG: hypothetical protein ACI4R8_01790 [Candidatus Caccovivens sp.]